MKEKKSLVSCPTMANGSTDHFRVFELWSKNKILSKISNFEQNVLVVWFLGLLIKGI